MTQVTFKGRSYGLDSSGFLESPKEWTEEFAEGMGRIIGVRTGLTERHWRMVRYLRRKFLREKTIPTIIKACTDTGLRLAELRALFPTGYHRGACKVAGINYRFVYENALWLTYETAPPAKQRYSLDELGFLTKFDSWDEDFAEMTMAQADPPVALTEEHWRVLRRLRAAFEDTGLIPNVYQACSSNGLSLVELGELFPSGYRRGACRAAGLPFLTGA